jgi:hypothetical protein
VNESKVGVGKHLLQAALFTEVNEGLEENVIKNS